VNDFFQAVRARDGLTTLSSILNRLVRYAEEHFQDEEKIALAAGVPVAILEPHKQEHEYLTMEIFHIAELYNSSDKVEESVEETASLLKKWLLEHIMNEDMKEAPYLSDMSDDDIKKILQE
jgi:hemerythrin-like metal-binding protein